ncbi:MAG: putative nucleotide binding protein [Thermoplasmata archaeon]|jgi:putative nucleotide binding protein|nr:putative nucleotide binding protein [Thermoplasmata archaeon]
MEEHVYILDYLPKGRPDDNRRKDPVAYGVGERNFVTLELAPKPNVTLLVGDRVSVLKEDPASLIDHVRGRVPFEAMTHAAQSELPYVIEQMVKAQEERFVTFYNNAGPVSLRMHQLELLPGLGKKLMQAILDDKKRNGPFKSFRDIDGRVKALHQPEKLISNRIVSEIQNPGEKYHLFVLPPAPEHDDFGRGPRGPPRGMR